jgi:3-dehydroquinate synthase
MASDDHLVHVALPGAAYDIHIGPGLLATLGERLKTLAPAGRIAVMTDSTVGPLALPALGHSCAAADMTIIAEHVVPAGENHKTLANVEQALDTFLRAKAERTTPIVALGGGMIGDMAGFAASILLRGVPFVQVPTTLLAMVDASVGGKTGVNHAVGKNLIGTFHQPIAVFADVSLLRTLPASELASGLAECIKHELIRDADGFAKLERTLDAIIAGDETARAELVTHNVRIKAAVVERDPYERGERAHLNFGHTFGHAIEKVSNFRYSHGESVALGMAAAGFMSQRLGLIEESARQRLLTLIRRAGLPTSGMTLDPSAVMEAMAFDKKVKSGRIRFVLLERIGSAMVRDDVPPALVREAVESLRG